MPDIVIHGASSFIGRHFTRSLKDSGNRVVVLARAQSNLDYLQRETNITVIRYQKSPEEVDVTALKTDHPAFYEFSWHGVFGTERNDPAQITVNIPLMIQSVNLAGRLSARHWIGIGSQAEYGNLDKRITEADDCRPNTLYGKSKLFCSHITADLCAAMGMQHTWLRLFSVYGPDDNHEWLIQYLIRKMLRHESIDVTKGDQKWDYLYIGDIVRLLHMLSTQPGAGIVNLGSGHSVAVREIIETLRRVTGTRSQIHYGAIPYRTDQVMFMEADNECLIKSTGWKPETTLEKGLSETIAHLKQEIYNGA